MIYSSPPAQSLSNKPGAKFKNKIICDDLLSDNLELCNIHQSHVGYT
jgi:hypothetical protein